MQELEVKNRGRDEAEALLVKPVPEMEPTAIHAPAVIRDADSGAVVAVLGRYEGDMAALRQAFKAYRMSTTKRTAGIRNRSAVFGYVARRVHMKREGCRTCNGATETPAAHRAILEAGARIGEMCAGLLPDRWEQDMATAAKIDPGWRMGDTPWTSGVLNETSPLPYHYDRNNLPAWSAMIVARRQTRGGLLSIPQYGLALECRDGDVLWFAGWNYVHGVTPIRKTELDGYRYTCVFYSVAGMQDCLPPAEELARAQRNRSQREDTMLTRQAEAGLLDRAPGA